MPIAAPGKSIMQQSIRAAFVKAKDAGAQDGADPDQITAELASDIAAAVDAYVTTIVVTVNVSPGIPVTTAGSPSAQVGATTGPGVGVS